MERWNAPTCRPSVPTPIRLDAGTAIVPRSRPLSLERWNGGPQETAKNEAKSGKRNDFNRERGSPELLLEDELAAIVGPAYARQERHAEQVDAQGIVGVHQRRSCTSAARVEPFAVATLTLYSRAEGWNPSRAASVSRSAMVVAPVSTTNSRRRPSTRASVQKCPPLPGESVMLRELFELVGGGSGCATMAEAAGAAEP